MAGYGKSKGSGKSVATKMSVSAGAKGKAVSVEKFTQTFSAVGCHLGHGGKKGV